MNFYNLGKRKEKKYLLIDCVSEKDVVESLIKNKSLPLLVFTQEGEGQISESITIGDLTYKRHRIDDIGNSRDFYGTLLYTGLTNEKEYHTQNSRTAVYILDLSTCPLLITKYQELSGKINDIDSLTFNDKKRKLKLKHKLMPEFDGFITSEKGIIDLYRDAEFLQRIFSGFLDQKEKKYQKDEYESQQEEKRKKQRIQMQRFENTSKKISTIIVDYIREYLRDLKKETGIVENDEEIEEVIRLLTERLSNYNPFKETIDGPLISGKRNISDLSIEDYENGIVSYTIQDLLSGSFEAILSEDQESSTTKKIQSAAYAMILINNFNKNNNGACNNLRFTWYLGNETGNIFEITNGQDLVKSLNVNGEEEGPRKPHRKEYELTNQNNQN